MSRKENKCPHWPIQQRVNYFVSKLALIFQTIVPIDSSIVHYYIKVNTAKIHICTRSKVTAPYIIIIEYKRKWMFAFKIKIQHFNRKIGLIDRALNWHTVQISGTIDFISFLKQLYYFFFWCSGVETIQQPRHGSLCLVLLRIPGAVPLKTLNPEGALPADLCCVHQAKSVT